MAVKLEIEYVDIGSLIPYSGNSRTHSKDQISQIASSMKTFGFTNPILVGENEMILAGHGRLAAAKKLKMKQVPIIRLNSLTEAEAKALVIADNKIAENAGWDEVTLIAELESLVEDNHPIDDLGFDADELARLLDQELEEEDEKRNPSAGTENPFKQMLFTLHKDQAGSVDDAIALAKTNPVVDTGLNENTSGNAITLICEQWLNSQ